MNRILKIALPALFLASNASAQQESMFTQFVYNTQVINPAYVGYREALSITAHHRSQWVGFKGAPSTQTISIYSPLKKQELAVGAVLQHDKIGPSRETSLQGDFAYRLRLTNKASLSFGAKVSAGLYQVNLAGVEISSDYYNLLNRPIPTDELYLYNTSGLVLPNIGFGAYYYKKLYFLGISAPKMLRHKLNKRNSTVYELLNGRTEPTLYLQGGYLFEIDKDFKFQPTGIIKITPNAPVSVGMFANAYFGKNIRTGVFYHIGETAGAIFQYQINDQIRLGYSFDVAASRLISTNFGSHEVMFNYLFNYRRKRIVYPRYF